MEVDVGLAEGRADGADDGAHVVFADGSGDVRSDGLGVDF